MNKILIKVLDSGNDTSGSGKTTTARYIQKMFGDLNMRCQYISEPDTLVLSITKKTLKNLRNKLNNCDKK